MIHRYKLSEEASHFILEESRRKFPSETGGILVGKIEDRCVFISHAIGPGKKACHTTRKFKRDGDYSQKQLEAIVRQTEDEFDYVGEWHSHLFNSQPSPTDVESMRWIANNDNYAVPYPVLLLCAFTEARIWQIFCYAVVECCLQPLEGC